MMPGPRDYSVGTERALFHLARGTCYAPDCSVPIMREVDGHPVTNVEIGHIRGAHPGSARYDPAMTDIERASFPNLLLLCTSHHKLVDRLAPDEHPVELLAEWKAEAEAGGGLDSLRDMDGLLTEDRLGELIEEAVLKLGPTREVSVELEGGLLYDEVQAITAPFDAMRELLRVNEHMRAAVRLAVVTIRNTGFADVSVESVTLQYGCAIGASPQTAISFLGRNDLPYLNPTTPHRLLAGESMRWLTKLDSLVWVVDRAPEATFISLHADVHLGSGEKAESSRIPWDDLPLHDLW